MKVFYLLLLSFVLCLFHADAQRRAVKTEVSEIDSAPKITRRGRARFVVPPEQQQLEEPTRRHEPIRRVTVRKRPEVSTEAAIPPRRTYEVEEIVDEAPLFKKNGKTRVFTETKFEAHNAPVYSTLFQPSTTESIDDILKSIGSDILDPTSSSVAASPTVPSTSETSSIEMSASELTKIENEISRVPPETTTPITSPRTTRRSNGRSRSNGNGAASTTIAPRATRTRPTRATRAPRKPEEQTPPQATRTVHRGSRRRLEISENNPAETVEQPLRSRTGRKIVRVEARPEKSSADLPQSPRTNSRRSFETPIRNVEIPSRNAEIPSRNSEVPSRNAEVPSRSVEISRNTETLSRNLDIPSRNTDIPYRGRFRTRSRDIPPIIDETKLEVLPLFERESKTVKPVRRVSRRRNYNSGEEVETSATENDVKVAVKPKQSVVVETRTESSFKRRKVASKPVTKESVVSKITEVTSKRTVTRRKVVAKSTTPKPTQRQQKDHKTHNPTTPKTTQRQSNDQKINNPSTPKTAQRQPNDQKLNNNSKSNDPKLNNSKTNEPKLNEPKLIEPPKFVPRGSKKAEVNSSALKTNKSSLSSSEEEIDESDNYPEQFKALLQAKKQKKESRSQHRLVTASPIVTKTTEKVTTSSTTSSTTSTTQFSSSEANRQLEDSENELDSSSLRSSRRRNPSSTTEKTTRTTRKDKFIRSTTSFPLVIKDHRFHAKVEQEVTSSPVKPRSFSSKPARGLYSSRKTKESHPKNKISTGQIPSPKKSNRYSSRYRNDASSRAAIRTSTNAPAYLPTIPTITPPTTSVKSSVALEDKDLGVEVISFDDPVNTVPSANLVSGEYLASSTENYLTSPLVQAAQTKTTEKPVSIIERIINSITAISTTEAPDTTKTTTQEPETETKKSAILKLATKKSTKLDKTLTTQRIPTVTVTSETPTTIIERILSSLSAIQVDNTTDIKTLKSKQVGTNFNTISESTTPITRVTKSALPAQFSTSVNPLVVLDEISNEQTLQKRTIGKLLALLNTLTSTPIAHPELVVVTPKATSYVVGTSGATTTIEPVFSNTITTTLAPQISTTTEPTTTTTPTTSTTTGQLFTSASPAVLLGSRIRSEGTTTSRYTITPSMTTPIPETTTPITSTSTQVPTLTSTEAVPTSTTLNSTINEIGALPLSFELSIPNSVTESSTISTTDSSSSVSTSFPTTGFAVDTERAFLFPSTIPALINFEVSPGSVSIFSANDLVSNTITRDDFPSTTVTITGKTNSPETSITTESSTEITTPIQTTTTIPENNASTQSPTTTTTTITTTTTSTGTTVNIDSRVGSTDSSENSTVAVTTEAPSTTETVATNNTTQDIASNVIDTTGPSEKANNQTSPPTNSSVQLSSRSGQSGRSGRLLNVVQEPVQNTIENSTDKDYFIFAVLNNNTVLRKRPSRFPNKDTPFLIVGVYPNNTIVRKFPNGTLVPMEPVIRVSGFDTRANPPPLPEITSNQVTPDQGSRPDNKNLQTVEQNTIPPLEANPLSATSANNATATTTSSTVAVQANPLSVSSSSSTSTESSTSSTSSRNSSANLATTTPGTTTTASTGSTTTLPSLTEILNGRTVQAFNSIINISDLTKTQTLDVDPKTNQVLNYDQVKNKTDIVYRWKPVTSPSYTFDKNKSTSMSTTLPTTTTLSNRILEDVTSKTRVPTTTQQPSTTPVFTTTTTRPATATTKRIQTTTVRRITSTPTIVPSTTTIKRTTTLPPSTIFRTTTEFPSTTTFFPSFLTTLFSTLRPRRLSTQAPLTIVTPVTTTIQSTLVPKVEVRGRSGDLATASTTRRTVSTTPIPTTTSASTLPSTTKGRRRGTTTIPTTTMPSTLPPSTTTINSARSARRSTTTKPPDSSTLKIKELTDQQRKELETIAQLEKEQEAILKQLAFLTNLNFANIRPTTDKNNLANRVIALAVERDKEARQKTTTTTTPSSETVAPEGNRKGKKITPSKDKTFEDLVKELNVATPSTLTSPYGKSNDAIIAQLLKEQGIGPTTPEALGDIYSQTTTTTRRPRTTTRQPGPLMQSLNWLLNVLSPQPTTTKRPRPKSRKPKAKPKPKPKPQPPQEEILTHQPTHITPVMTPAPPRNIVSALSQADIQKLIKQLEAAQRDPDNNQSLDFSSIKSLQTLLNTDGGVQVSSSGTTGATSRSTTPLPRKERGRNRVVKSTTAAPLSVSNSLLDDEEFTTTTRPRASLPPVRLRPVPGIEESDTLIRGQLITAAVNVTRAISSFLGTALQGAATGFQTLIGTGTRAVGSLMQVSSNTSSGPG